VSPGRNAYHHHAPPECQPQETRRYDDRYRLRAGDYRVRKLIPAIIAADGGQPVTRVLDDAGYEAALRAKLLEEAHEAQAASDGQLTSELADVLEVLQALAAAHRMSWEEIVSEAARKRAERGGFDNRIFLEYVDQTR
jgi:predicted house-cleaning noncanonical NTP pyrophosphatase (MazG superfamily)